MLLVEDNGADARLIREMLLEADTDIELTWVDNLADGLAQLEKGPTDIVLLDLLLPDSKWPDTLLKVLAQPTDVPVVVLTGLDDYEQSVTALKKGAQDYLVKDQTDSRLLMRTIRYAIERHRIGMELRAMSLTDELTGIYNRRGFLALAQQQLKMADRMKMKLLLLFADVDDMKGINDSLGHHVGDRALIDTANILKETFRESDIIARIGGDEFAIIALEESKVNDTLFDRLQLKLDELNAAGDRPYKLSLSAGIVHYDPDNPCGTDELLDKADRMMYERKRLRKKSRD